MPAAPREDNYLPGLVAKSNVDNTPVILEADPTTKRLLVSPSLASGGATEATLALIDLSTTASAASLALIETNTTAVAASIATVAGAVSGSEMQVDVITLPSLPAGTNEIGSVISNLGATDTANLVSITNDTGTVMAKLALIDLSTTASAASLAILDDIVSGSEAQVDIVGSLPTGTNSIGQVTANAGTNLNTSLLALETGGKLALIDLSTTLIATAVVGGEMVVAQGTASSLNAQVVGNIAHDLGVSGNPVQMAGEARSTERTAVASADVSRFITDLVGKQIVLPYANPELSLSGVSATAGAGGTNQLIAAQGGSVRIYVTSLVISNVSATNTEIDLQEGGSTVLATYPAPTVGGAIHSLPSPIRLTENAALGFQARDAASTITVTAIGYSGV